MASAFPWRRLLLHFPVCSLFLVLCLAGALIVQLAPHSALLAAWTFPVQADPESGLSADLRRFWRLLTPAFLHFGAAHLIFNLLGLWIFGAPIERGRGSLRFALLLVLSAVCSHLLQFQASGTANFGGLSGGLYGLVAYLLVWNAGIDERRGLTMHYPLLMFMVIWMLLGFTGLLDLALGLRMANFAHLGGFLFGVAFGLVDRGADHFLLRPAR